MKTNRKKSEWGAPSQLSQWSVPLLISSLRWVESALKTIFVKKKTRNKSVSHRDERWARTFHCLSLREPQLTPGPPGRAGVPHPSAQPLGPPLPPGEGRPVCGHSGSGVRRRTAGLPCGGCSRCRGAAPRGPGPPLPHPRAQYSLEPTSPQRLRAFSPPPPRKPASHPVASTWLCWGVFTPLPVGP